MHQSKQKQDSTKSQNKLQTSKGLEEQESLLDQQNPLVQQFSGLGNIPNAGVHAQILNGIPANQIAANPQLMLQMQQQFGNSHVSQVVQMARENTGQSFKGESAPHGVQQENKTGLPDNLKAGIENLSGISMDDVKVHYNSAKPAEVQALAYTQGTDIYVAPRQETHLSHEAWHVVQQKQGRVKPTIQAKGVAINDHRGLEKEADVMGAKALHIKRSQFPVIGEVLRSSSWLKPDESIQGKLQTLGEGIGAFRMHSDGVLKSASSRQPSNLLIAPMPALASVIQCKKTTKPDDSTLISKFTVGHKLPKSVLSGKTTDSEKGNAIWEHLKNTFDDNKDKGQRYWDKLQQTITDYKDIDKKADVESKNKIKRSDYDKKFSENYSNTDPILLGGTNYRVNTEGYDPLKSPKPTVGTDMYTGNYSNEFDISSGSIKAAWNFAAHVDRDTGKVTSYDDKALEAGKGLNNSEILWQQFQLAARSHFRSDLLMESRVIDALKNISTIKRDTVINDETNEVVYMSYPDGQDWKTNKEWRPTEEEFFAILGTPNARSSPYFLMDHLDQIEKTIEKITTTSAGGIDISFTSI